MPSLSGSAVAVKQARFGIARFGASRFGYYTYNVVVIVNDVNVTTSLRGKPTIELNLNDEPDRASFVLKRGATVPTAGQTVSICLGTSANPIFGGQIIEKRHQRHNAAQSVQVELVCTDWGHLFDRELVRTHYAAETASAIAQHIIENYTTGFTFRNVAADLATIDFFPCALDTPSQALRRLANLIDGGFYIDANRDVHLFGPTGESGSTAPTAPRTLTTTLSTLKQFSYETDVSQVRTRVLMETESTRTTADVDVGMQAIPVDTAEVFPNPMAGEVFIAEYGVFTAAVRSIASSGTTVNTNAAAGATQIYVDNLAAVFGAGFFPGWVQIGGDQWVYYNDSALTAAPVGYLVIPASGAGSLARDVVAAEAVVNVPFIASFTDGANVLTRRIKAGTEIAALTTVNDAAAQTAMAAIEGGDGIHEHHIQDRRWDVDNASTPATAELTSFKSALEQIAWVTYDMNAAPGALQVVNMTGTDTISTTLLTTRVSLRFPIRNGPPERTCEASSVRQAGLVDLVTLEGRP